MQLVLARPAVSQAHTALNAHEDAVRARCERLLEEAEAWAQWMVEHHEHPGAWDALPAAEKRKAIKAGEAPPQSASTWRDERAGDGSRQSLHIRRKRSTNRAVHWDTPPTRVDDSTLSLPGLGEIEVVANNPLPEAKRLRAVRVCMRPGTRGGRRVEVHLSVRADVVPRTKRPPKVPLVADADMGCRCHRYASYHLRAVCIRLESVGRTCGGSDDAETSNAITGRGEGRGRRGQA